MVATFLVHSFGLSSPAGVQGAVHWNIQNANIYCYSPVVKDCSCGSECHSPEERSWGPLNMPTGTFLHNEIMPGFLRSSYKRNISTLVQGVVRWTTRAFHQNIQNPNIYSAPVD